MSNDALWTITQPADLENGLPLGQRGVLYFEGKEVARLNNSGGIALVHIAGMNWYLTPGERFDQ